MSTSLRSRLNAGEHLVFDDGASLESRTIPASWILETLVAGGTVSLRGAFILETIEIVHGSIGGYLLLTNCLISKLRIVGCSATTRIWLRGCWLRGEVNLDRTTFHDKITIERSTIRRGLRAERAILNEGILFDHVRTKHLHLTGLESRSVVTFGGLIAAGSLRLDQATLARLNILSSRIGPKSKPHIPVEEDQLRQMVALRRGLTLEGSRVDGTLQIVDSYFNGYASFGTLSVAGNAFVEKCRFGFLILARGHFRQSLSISNSAVSKAAFLDGITVENLFRLMSSRFSTDVRLSGLTCTELTIEGCTFDERSLMERLTVNGRFDIAISHFKKDAKFVGTTINGDFTILGSAFKKEAVFGNLTVAGDMILKALVPDDRLTASRWSGPAIPSLFEDISAFTNSSFQGPVRIVGVSFSNWVTFANSRFASDVTFSSRVNETLSFAACSIERSINLRHAIVTRSLKLQDATINRLILSSSLEPGRDSGEVDVLSAVTDIDISGCTYNRLEGRWRLLLSKQLPVIPQPFVYLEQFLRQAGHNEWADDVYYRGRQLTGKSDRRVIKRIGNAFADLAFGYGVKPWNAAAVAAALPILAALLYVFRPNLAQPKFAGPYDCAHPVAIGFLQALWLSCHEYLPLAFDPEGSWVTSTCAGSATLSLSLRLFGLVFIPLAVAAISGLMKYIGPR